VNPIALAVSAIDPCMITGAAVASASGADPLVSVFAELLQAAEPTAEDTSAAPVEAQGETPKATPRHDAALPLDEIAEPAKEADKPEDSSAALAYAFVASMPITPEPAPPVESKREAHEPATLSPQAAVLPMVSPVDTPRTELTPAPKPTPTATTRDQQQRIDVPPVETAEESQPSGTPQVKLPVDSEAHDSAPQRVILEARITKQPAVTEPGKPAVHKETSTSAVPEPESNRPVTPAVKEVNKTEFAPPEHKEEQPLPSQEKQPAPARQEHAAAPLVTPQFERPSTAQPASHEPVHPTSTQPDIPEPAAADQTPLKRMDLRIPDANGGGVTVRLQERGGAVHVSVRSNDAQLANGVAEHLPELTRNLDRQGYRAETRTPAGANPIADTTPEGLLRTGSTRDHAVETARAHSDAVPHRQPEQARSGNETSDGHRKPDWQEEIYKRPRRPSEDNFKEFLS
jgi:hypothetical protein